ncbi:MAG: hypothetical protein ACYCW6_25030 [Candidatus Xenobia bacterium]
MHDILTTRLSPSDLIIGITMGALQFNILPAIACEVVLQHNCGTALAALWFCALVLLTLQLSWLTLLPTTTQRCLWALPMLAGGILAYPATGWAVLIELLGTIGLYRTATQTLPVRRHQPWLPLPRWLRTNPIVMREWMRALGVQRVRILLRAFPLLLLVGLGLLVHAEVPWQPVLLVTLFIVQPLRAAYRAGHALQVEREQQTLLFLQQSALRADEFVDGWTLAASLEPAVESLIIGVIATLLPGYSEVVGMAYADLLILIPFSACLGVMMSSMATSRIIASRFLHLWSALYLCFGVGPIALAASTHGVLDLGTAVTSTVLVAAACIFIRYGTLSRIRDVDELVGFSSR